MIEKKTATEHGDAVSTADIRHTDNGQVVFHIESTLAGATHAHRVTVGSEDGNDAVASMTSEQLLNHLQSHLDHVRAQSIAVLCGRARVKKILGDLK